MNKFRVVKKIFSFIVFVSIILPSTTHAQCPTDVNYGKNLVVNGNFSNGYTGWTFTPQTVPWDPGNIGAADGYRQHGTPSLPGDILVGTNPNAQFNPGFQNFGDHTTGSGNFLMVDGVCKLGVKLFSQNVTVTANTNYYFSIWINSLKDNPTNPGVLNFDVGGANIGANIIAPALGGGSVGGGWKQYEVVWFSGAIAGNVAISIENQNTLDCGNQVDFAIDDIAFIPGCGFGSLTPQPSLGADQSFCGKGGSITLNSGVASASDINVTWNDGTGSGIIGAGAAYSKIITAPGTYYVCVTKTGSCAKIDTVVITNTFTPATSPNANLCTTGGSAPLDAVFTGIGVTYQWKIGGVNLPAPSTNRTYTATTTGNYTVEVTTPGCGTVTSGTTVISSSATAAPTTSPNADLCMTNPAPLDAVLTGTGITYQWKLGGVNLPAPSTNRTYSAISPGTYTVDVKLPGCVTTTSGSTVITSSSPVTPVDAVFCASTAAASGVTLGATGTNSANFKWYTGSTGGTAFHTGSSYVITPDIPMGTPGPIIYYVQDETINNGTVGPTTYSNGNNGDGSGSWNSNFLTITPGGDFTINSLQIPFIFYGAAAAFNVTIEVTDATGASLPTTRRFTSANTTTPVTTGASKLYTFTFTGFDVKKAWGSTLGLKIFSHNTTGQTMVSTTGYTYPFNSSLTSVVTIPNAKMGGSTVTNGGYPYLFNMAISATTPCSRIPVRAINNCPQPVTWTAFYLVPQGDNTCKIVWGTAKELNNQYFSVERSSDGVHFETIGTVSGAGNRDYASNYYFIDEAPLEGIAYYRVTQHDLDGKYSSTEIKPYNSNGLTEISTFPNPYQQTTTLVVTGTGDVPYTYTIYSVSGQLVETSTASYNVPVSIGGNLAKGMYMLSVTNEVEKITTKIVKQ